MAINFVLESEPEDKPERKRFNDYPIHDLESWSKMPSISWLVDIQITARELHSYVKENRNALFRVVRLLFLNSEPTE